jgi:quercetin dioxygenase-like cupin family protein
MSAFVSLAEMAPLPIWQGILARVVEGREMTFAVVELDAHAIAARHQHPNEQLGIVLEGSMTFTIGDERREIHAGDAYEIPGNVPHEAVAGPSGAVVIDVFAPVRADWHRHVPQAPRPPLWP